MINKLKEGGCMFGKTVLAPINPPEELLFSLVCHCLLTCRTGQSQSCQAQPTKSLQRELVSPSAKPAVFVWSFEVLECVLTGLPVTKRAPHAEVLELGMMKASLP